jgi:hypothetical protein
MRLLTLDATAWRTCSSEQRLGEQKRRTFRQPYLAPYRSPLRQQMLPPRGHNLFLRRLQQPDSKWHRLPLTIVGETFKSLYVGLLNNIRHIDAPSQFGFQSRTNVTLQVFARRCEQPIESFQISFARLPHQV